MQNVPTKCAARDFCKFENRKIKLTINRLREARPARAEGHANENIRGRNQNSSWTLHALDNPQGAKFWRRKCPRESQGRVF
jgi:hypothetical protein